MKFKQIKNFSPPNKKKAETPDGYLFWTDQGRRPGKFLNELGTAYLKKTLHSLKNEWSPSESSDSLSRDIWIDVFTNTIHYRLTHPRHLWPA